MFTKRTYQAQVAQLLEGRIHAFLHDEELLFLLLHKSGQFTVLGINLVQQFVDLHLFGLDTVSWGGVLQLTLSESSSSVSCLLYFDMTLDTSELL